MSSEWHLKKCLLRAMKLSNGGKETIRRWTVEFLSVLYCILETQKTLLWKEEEKKAYEISSDSRLIFYVPWQMFFCVT